MDGLIKHAKTTQNMYEIKGNGYLTREELQDLLEAGFIGPKELSVFPAELHNKLLLDLSKFLHSASALSRTNDIQWFVPSVMEFLHSNVNDMAQKAVGIFNTNIDNLIVTIQQFSADSSSPTILHNDYSPTSHTVNINFVNFHLALTDVNEETNKFILFPGTHRDVEYPYYAFQHLTKNGVSFNQTAAFKSMAIWDNALFGDIAKSKGKLLNSSYGKYAIDDGGYAFHLLHRFYMQKYKDDNIEARYVDTKVGEYIILLPTILHGSTESVGEKNRVSFVIRFTKIEDNRVFENDVLANTKTKKLVRALYKTFMGNEIQDLLDSCESIGSVVNNLPHRERLSVQEIKTILFGNPNISDDTMMSMQLALREKTTLPFVSITKLNELNCKAGFMPEDICNDLHYTIGTHDEL